MFETFSPPLIPQGCRHIFVFSKSEPDDADTVFRSSFKGLGLGRFFNVENVNLVWSTRPRQQGKG